MMEGGLTLRSNWLKVGSLSSWGFALGAFKTTTVLRINESGEWTEHGELVINDRAPQKMIDLTVRRISH